MTPTPVLARISRSHAPLFWPDATLGFQTNTTVARSLPHAHSPNFCAFSACSRVYCAHAHACVQVAPRQLGWCGSDSVVAYWDQLGTGTDTLLMVGPSSKYINYSCVAPPPTLAAQLHVRALSAWHGSSTYRHIHTHTYTHARARARMMYTHLQIPHRIRTTMIILNCFRLLFSPLNSYSSRLHLMPEVDGLRVISEDKHELLQAVPESVEKIFQLGFSRHPGAMLYMARQGYVTQLCFESCG